MINLMNLTCDELEKYIISLSQPGFRGRQIYKWLNEGVYSFEDMNNIPKSLREELQIKAYTGNLEIANKLVSKIDGTVKYLYKLHDGNSIESVVMEYKHGTTICISTQVGCKMKCAFCASGEAGFIRDLTAGEMLSQVITSNKDLEKNISNVVLMGIGEPLDNYDNVIKFIKMANDKRGLNIGIRHFSLSTAGVVPKIYDLLKEGMGLTLSVSLHNADNYKRSDIMPINRKYSIDKLLEACKIYTEETKRRITFEYALIAGVNDTAEDAGKLGKLLKGMLCHVNLIPVNQVEGKEFIKSNKSTIGKFVSVLEKYNIEVTLRREMGSDISAACGQLRKGV